MLGYGTPEDLCYASLEAEYPPRLCPLYCRCFLRHFFQEPLPKLSAPERPLRCSSPGRVPPLSGGQSYREGATFAAAAPNL